MTYDDLERPRFGLGWIALLVLAVIGFFTLIGWVLSTVWTLIQLAIVAAVVIAIVAAVKASRR